jgi:hypothetical protein
LGTTKTVCSFRKQLSSKIENELLRESYFTRYLAKLHGNESQTLLLCSAYSVILVPLLAWKEVTLPKIGREQLLVDSLSFGDPNLKVHSGEEVDATIASAIPERYGQFVVWTEPILLQVTMNCLAEECHSHFPFPMCGGRCSGGASSTSSQVPFLAARH